MKKIRSVTLMLVLLFTVFTAVFSAKTTSHAASYYLNTSYKMMYQGQTYTNSVNTSKTVKWSSSNSDIASVNSEGKITANNAGIATISAKVNDTTLKMKVEVVSKTAYNAVNYAKDKVGCSYSQSRRMDTGYYDCGSLVWRAYSNSGLSIGGKTSWAPTAADTARILANNYTVVSYSYTSSSNLLPGDLIFTSTYSNGRYRNITHAIIYVGNGRTVEAANSRVGVVARDYAGSNVVLIARPSVAPVKLRAPEMKSAKATSSTGSSVKISWKKVGKADGYYVYRKVKDGEYTKIGTIKDNETTTFVDDKAYAGTYYYNVKAYNSNKTSKYASSSVKATTRLAATSYFTSSYKDNKVTLKWDGVANADGYVIYRENIDGTYTKLTAVKASKLQYTDKEVLEGNDYSYSIKAYRTTDTGSKTYSTKAFTAISIDATIPETVPEEIVEETTPEVSETPIDPEPVVEDNSDDNNNEFAATYSLTEEVVETETSNAMVVEADSNEENLEEATIETEVLNFTEEVPETDTAVVIEE